MMVRLGLARLRVQPCPRIKFQVQHAEVFNLAKLASDVRDAGAWDNFSCGFLSRAALGNSQGLVLARRYRGLPNDVLLGYAFRACCFLSSSAARLKWNSGLRESAFLQNQPGL
jgi:hypothetical protein